MYNQDLTQIVQTFIISQDPNTIDHMESAPGMPARRVGGGNPASKQMNKHGEVTIRGCGAATKGIKSRGPMA
jgi:hypothetical protein